MTYRVDVIEGSLLNGTRRRGTLSFATETEACNFAADTYPDNCGHVGVVTSNDTPINCTYINGDLWLVK